MSDTRRGFLAKTGLASLAVLLPWKTGRADDRPIECTDENCPGIDYSGEVYHTPWIALQGGHFITLRDGDQLPDDCLPGKLVVCRHGQWHGVILKDENDRVRYWVYHLCDVTAANDWMRA